MTKEYRLQIRLTRLEEKKLRAEALKKDLPMAEVVRDYIKALPDPPIEEQEPTHQ